MYNDYETLIGIEVHIELKTKEKIFCSCKNEFGKTPNTLCCPVCTGQPGTLPKFNRQVAEYAVKAGLALNCSIANISGWDRKNYYYPDLPKAYQITQFERPLCTDGYINIETDDGVKRIGITRIHMEEDAGKLVWNEGVPVCDYNRCGVPLIEIVSEPDIRSAREAVAYVKKLRDILLYCGISDCKMQEGSLRCDVNLSVRKKGDKTFGTRCELKNINSFQFIEKAVEYEAARQIDMILKGESIISETRKFDSVKGITLPMRIKENENDYRYFPEPDLCDVVLTDEETEIIRKSIPELPDERKRRYMNDYELSVYDSELIISDIKISDYFDMAVKSSCMQMGKIKILCNLLTGEILKLYDKSKFNISPENLSEIAGYIYDKKITIGTAKKLINILWNNKNNNSNIYALIDNMNLWQINDEELLRKITVKQLENNPEAVSDYKSGKSNAIKVIIGGIMRETSGNANPEIVNKILSERLN